MAADESGLVCRRVAGRDAGHAGAGIHATRVASPQRDDLPQTPPALAGGRDARLPALPRARRRADPGASGHRPGHAAAVLLDRTLVDVERLPARRDGRALSLGAY